MGENRRHHLRDAVPSNLAGQKVDQQTGDSAADRRQQKPAIPGHGEQRLRRHVRLRPEHDLKQDDQLLERQGAEAAQNADKNCQQQHLGGRRQLQTPEDRWSRVPDRLHEPPGYTSAVSRSLQDAVPTVHLRPEMRNTKTGNSKHETRNPKQIRMKEIRMSPVRANDDSPLPPRPSRRAGIRI